MHKKTTFSLALVLLLLAYVPLMSVSAQEVPRPYHLIYATFGEPESVDPHWSYDSSGMEFANQVYDTLIFFDGVPVNEFMPLIASEVPTVENGLVSADLMTYTFPIRSGIPFHNGEILTTEDVAYSIERMLVMDRDGGPSVLLLEPLLDMFDTVDATAEQIDNAVTYTDTEVTFHLSKLFPYEAFMQLLAQPWSAILCKSWSIEQGCWPGTWDVWRDYNVPEISPLDDPTNVVCGTGPYKFDYWEHDVEYSIVKNDDYWGGWTPGARRGARGWLERVTVKMIDEWSTRKMMFTAADVDFCDVPTPNIPEAEAIDGVRCHYPFGQLYLCCMFYTFDIAEGSLYMPQLGGVDKPDLWTDPDLRKAFAHAFDYATYIEDVHLNEAWEPNSVIPRGYAEWNPDQEKYELDLAKAEEYFRKAWDGAVWEQGIDVILTYNTGNVPRQMACEMMRDQVEPLNDKFTFTVVGVDWPAYLGALVAHELSFFAIAWGADYADAYSFANPFMHTGGDLAWCQVYGNSTIDALVVAALAETDPAEKQAMYNELQQIYYEDCPAVLLYQLTIRHFERDWVQGYYFNMLMPGSQGYYYYHYWKEDLPGEDLDRNGVVDIFDIVMIAKAFGSYFTPPTIHPEWDSRADLVTDRVIDIFDIVKIAKQFGFAAGPWTPPS